MAERMLEASVGESGTEAEGRDGGRACGKKEREHRHRTKGDHPRFRSAVTSARPKFDADYLDKTGIVTGVVSSCIEL